MAGLRINCIVFTCTLLLQFCVSYVTSERQPICSIPSESCGPVPPVLPESFTMKGTRVDILGKSFMWMEEYFDAEKQRVKIVILQDGNEINLIFNFKSSEVVTYVNLKPGGSASMDDPSSDEKCWVQKISDSELKDVLRYRSRYGEARMYSSNQVLNYGGPHLFAYVNGSNSTDEARGLPTYAFKGCVYDEDDKRTIDSTYRWAEREKVVAASGVDKMPVKIENKGKIYNESKGEYEDINEVYDIVWFDGNSNFPDSIFQIPPRVQCSYVARADQILPEFPSYFSTRLEVMSMTEDWQGRIGKVTYDWYEEIWFDKDLELVRLDFVPTDNQGKDAKDALGAVPISAVYDFKTGVVHYTEKAFGKCVMKKISRNDFLVSKESKNLDSLKLAETKEILGFDEPTMTYKGKYTVRDIETTAWAGLHTRTDKEGSERSVYSEFYVTYDSWHGDYDDGEYFNIPIRETSVVFTTDDGQDAMKITEVNFFKFKPSQPHLSIYDIDGCLSSYERRFFYFELPGDNRDDISHHHEAFLDDLRSAIAIVSDVQTTIRVQELEAMFLTAKNVYQVSFSLLEVPPQTVDVSLPGKGVDLKTAANNLFASINGEGTPLTVNFQYNKEKAITIVSIRNSLKELQAMREAFVNMYSPGFPSENVDFPNEMVPVMMSFTGQQIMYAPVKEKKTSSGYSSGSLAGLAISMLIIGTLAGLAGMVFYNKRKLQRDSERIQLS